MSFSNDIKEYILNEQLTNDCCNMASLCAYINTIGSLEISGGGVSFSVKTDNLAILEQIQTIINKFYSDKIDEMLITKQSIGKTVLYEYECPSVVGNRILKDLGIVKLDNKNNHEINFGVDHHIIMEDCCKKSYIKSAFVSVGSVSVPIDSGAKGYHFEMEFTNNEQAKVLSNLLGEFGFITRKVERNNKYVVYIKECEVIADFIAFVGDTKSYLKLQNEIVNRDMRNSINRQSNCIQANIEKTVQASVAQINAIKIIEDTIGIDSLPKNLQEFAILRKNNPQASLTELLELYDGKITKSGMNYKLNKIVEISKNL